MKQFANITLTDEQYNEILSQYAYEFLSENNPDDCLYSMDEFDELMNDRVQSEGALWLAQRIHFGDFNPNHDWFYFNGYGNLESTEWADDYYADHVDEDDFLQYCDDQGYLDEYKEEDEEEDED